MRVGRVRGEIGVFSNHPSPILHSTFGSKMAEFLSEVRRRQRKGRLTFKQGQKVKKVVAA